MKKYPNDNKKFEKYFYSHFPLKGKNPHDTSKSLTIIKLSQKKGLHFTFQHKTPHVNMEE
jgi:hypothetical protein